MEKLSFYFLVILILPYTALGGGAAATVYIKASCKNTLYQNLCVSCLSPYASSIQENDHELAKAAITVSLNNAKSAAAFVSKLGQVSRTKPREFQAVKDCINSLANGVASLDQSVQELAQVGQFKGQDFQWHMSNVQTWVSSALTSENTCASGFSDGSMDGNLKDAINRRMVYVAQITSNALALVDRFALRHKYGTHMP